MDQLALKAMASPQMPMGFTQLSPMQQMAFMQWYQNIARQRGLNMDPYHPGHHYDHVAAFLAGAQPKPSADPSQDWHWPSQFKMAGHPNRFVPQPGGVLWDTQQNVKLGDIRQQGSR